MNAQRHQQVKKLFLAASELDERQAAAFLDQACPDDPELRREVESLLKHHYPTTIIGQSPDDATAAKIPLPIPRIPLQGAVTTDYADSGKPKPDDRFPPGTMIAGRYRILGQLGRGGMGVVYRADDLKLDQPVALKFLSHAKAHDKAWLARFHTEVRLARRVTHPNVNRVYDIGEADGETFISMEYVDGEDLESLLRRIGRFSGDKAVEIARQLCAGLGAAHDRGVLHRDLKPANVMIDGRGQVRITDFGIAALATEAAGRPLAGTPAFMAPELFQGKQPSVRSDIFSLGVVLYELVTGRQPLEGMPASRRARTTTPTSPSAICPDVDPAVERIIVQCLQQDPARRPDSTHAIAAALPGGDPLAEALAAGETPSPGMVAAAGTGAGLRPKLAVAYLAVALLGLTMVVLLADRTLFLPQAGLSKQPAVLADKAEEIIRRLGHQAAVAGNMQGFAIDEGYLQYMTASHPHAGRWDHLPTCRPPAVFFWYRQGDNRLNPPAPFGEPALRRKLPAEPGMNTVRLDGKGRLLMFSAMPTRAAHPSVADEAPDWTLPFAMAGFEMADFKPVAPVAVPPMYADRVVAWEGAYPEDPEMGIRIEGASLGGRVVYFAVLPPWQIDEEAAASPGNTTPASLSGGSPRSLTVRFVLYLTALLAALVLARRNARLRRGDQRGAQRLALFVFALGLLDWMLGERHSAVFAEEAVSCYLAIARATLAAAGTWVCYIALEPYVRRRWPQTLITWSRVLQGRLRDPLVGRDMLIGGLFGIGLVLVLQFDTLLPAWLQRPEPAPKLPGIGYELTELYGMRYKLGTLIGVLLTSIIFGLVVLMLMLLLRVALRIPWLAALAFCVLLTAAFSAVSSYDTFLPWLTNAVLALAVVFILTRVGLVAVILGWFVSSLIMTNPITADPGAWYFPAGSFAVIFTAILLIYGFYASLAGQPILAGRLLDE